MKPELLISLIAESITIPTANLAFTTMESSEKVSASVCDKNGRPEIARLAQYSWATRQKTAELTGGLGQWVNSFQLQLAGIA